MNAFPSLNLNPRLWTVNGLSNASLGVGAGAVFLGKVVLASSAVTIVGVALVILGALGKAYAAWTKQSTQAGAPPIASQVSRVGVAPLGGGSRANPNANPLQSTAVPASSLPSVSSAVGNVKSSSKSKEPARVLTKQEQLCQDHETMVENAYTAMEQATQPYHGFPSLSHILAAYAILYKHHRSEISLPSLNESQSFEKESLSTAFETCQSETDSAIRLDVSTAPSQELICVMETGSEKDIARQARRIFNQAFLEQETSIRQVFERSMEKIRLQLSGADSLVISLRKGRVIYTGTIGDAVHANIYRKNAFNYWVSIPLCCRQEKNNPLSANVTVHSLKHGDIVTWVSLRVVSSFFNKEEGRVALVKDYVAFNAAPERNLAQALIRQSQYVGDHTIDRDFPHATAVVMKVSSTPPTTTTTTSTQSPPAPRP